MRNQSLNRNKTKKAFVLPAIISLVIVGFIPFLISIYLSQVDLNLLKPADSMKFVGLKNFISVIKDKRAQRSILTTMFYYVGCISIETFLALAISLFLNREFKAKNLVRSLIIIPMFITPIVVGLIWRMLYDPTGGLINYFLGLLGIGTIDWLGNKNLALFSIMLVDAWEWTPYLIIIFLAGLDSMPEELFEAAMVDGANEFETTMYITIPLLKPAIIVGVCLRSLDIFKAFDIIYAMTKGGPGLATETANMYAYILGFNFFDVSKSIAFTLLITISITVVFGNVYKGLQVRGDEP